MTTHHTHRLRRKHDNALQDLRKSPVQRGWRQVVKHSVDDVLLVREAGQRGDHELSHLARREDLQSLQLQDGYGERDRGSDVTINDEDH